MEEELHRYWIANFWKRIFAIFIDGLVLGLVGFALGMAFGDVFVQIGAWGRFVGFAIALVYFGLLNSKLFKGQTLGKRLLKLRVVDSENQTITLGRSILRCIVLIAPFFVNGIHFSNEAMLSFLIYPISLVIFGGLFSIFYLYVFNRVTRQSLHDLVVGTYVVNATVEKQRVGKVWKVHLIVVAVLIVAAAIVPVFTGKLALNEPFKGMSAVQSALLNEPGVTYATISSNTVTFSSATEGTRKTTYVSVRVFLSSNNIGDAKFARHLATMVLKLYPEAWGRDAIRVTLTYGYDIGIWSRWSNHAYGFRPSEFGAEPGLR